MNISENLLFFIWQNRLLSSLNLVGMQGEQIRVIHPGMLNTNAGPDFTEANLLIGNTRWAGNIEIHVKSSDWVMHRHQQNPAYDTVILHVVYEHDQIILNSSGNAIPTLILKGLFDEALIGRYNELLISNRKFPCSAQIKEIDSFTIRSFLSRLVVERLELKSNEVLAKLADTKGDWNETFYYFLARNFGFKVNAPAFELLAGSLSHQILAKHADNQQQMEALLFGQAGFLSLQTNNGYPGDLLGEYDFLKHKYALKPIEVSVWKFLRMRPMNFPTIRIAQLAALLFNTKFLFSKVMETNDLKQLAKLFELLPVNSYWTTHYHFRKETKEMRIQLGTRSIENIMINTACVFLFSYGKFTDNYALVERSLNFLEQIHQESNSLLTPYTEAGVLIDSAFMSQAVLQLNKFYCSQKKCLNCGIGVKILRR
ncbi:MAG: DUF2851 family protein [Bacteroidota bacterium]